jgi:putative transcriptional regulator
MQGHRKGRRQAGPQALAKSARIRQPDACQSGARAMTTRLTSELTGKILIALLTIADPRFARSVILICAHTPEFAMGIVINKPMVHLSVPRLLDQLGVPPELPLAERFVLDGGPVGTDRGFVLHTGDAFDDRATLHVTADIKMTATRPMLAAIASADPPERFQLALGYSGWGEGQIELELADNAWLVSEADADLVYSDAHSTKWRVALSSLGIDLGRLQIDTGNA